MNQNIKKLGRLNARQKERLVGYAFIAPALIYMLLMIGYPVLYNIAISFTDLSAFNLAQGKTKNFIGFENYKTIFSNSLMYVAIRNTMIYTIISISIQFTLGLLFALLFNKKFAIAKPLRGALVISWMMPITVTALLFKYMLSSDVGVINYFFVQLGIIQEPIPWLLKPSTAIWGPIMANSWVGVPFNMLLLTTGLSSISDEVYESASIDGANAFKRFKYITLPLLGPAILSVLVLGFVYTFKVFDLIFVMTGGGPINATEVLATYSYRLSFSQYKFGEGASVANILFLILFCIALVYLKLLKKEETA